MSSSRLVEAVKLTQLLLQVPVPALAAASGSDGHRGAVLPLGSTEGAGKDASLLLCLAMRRYSFFAVPVEQ